jgi:hypothetical protein
MHVDPELAGESGPGPKPTSALYHYRYFILIALVLVLCVLGAYAWTTRHNEPAIPPRQAQAQAPRPPPQPATPHERIRADVDPTELARLREQLAGNDSELAAPDLLTGQDLAPEPEPTTEPAAEPETAPAPTTITERVKCRQRGCNAYAVDSAATCAKHTPSSI